MTVVVNVTASSARAQGPARDPGSVDAQDDQRGEGKHGHADRDIGEMLGHQPHGCGERVTAAESNSVGADQAGNGEHGSHSGGEQRRGGPERAQATKIAGHRGLHHRCDREDEREHDSLRPRQRRCDDEQQCNGLVAIRPVSTARAIANSVRAANG